jgi:hypothetical protein
MLGKATVYTVLFPVFRANVTAEIGTVDFNVPVDHCAAQLGSKGFPDLVRQDESCLVLAIEIAGQLESRNAFGRVHDNADRREQVSKGHLAGREDSSRRDAVLLAAVLAREAAAGRMKS